MAFDIAMQPNADGNDAEALPSISYAGLRELSDAALVGRCRFHDHGAFAVLIKRYKTSIFHLAHKLTGNREDAHDIAAIATMRIHRSIGAFEDSTVLKAWVNRIVVNVYYDFRRKSMRRVSCVSLDSMPDAESFLADEREHTQSPQRAAESSDSRRILNIAVEALPRDQKQVVNLYHYRDRTYLEIAELLRVPVGTVKSRLNRARLQLRALLAPQMSALLN